MRNRLLMLCVVGTLVGFTGCNKTSTAPVASAPKLGIRPYGAHGTKPDYSKVPPELMKVFDYIDEHFDEHVENLQKWIQQPASPTAAKAFRNRPKW